MTHHIFPDLTKFLKDDIELSQVLGQGAYSRVYLGKLRHDPTIGQFSVKIPTQDVTEYEVRDELECLQRFNHVNIVRLVGIALSDRTSARLTWILMEYAEQGDLSTFVEQRIEREIEVDFKLWTDISLGIAEGMKYLHRNLTVHCDLHTKNCFLNGNNVVKVGDFGLALILDRNEDEAEILSQPFGDHGRPTDLPGTQVTGMRWKAPEYIPGRNFPPVHLRPGDVWSYGILLFEFWSEGRVPYGPLENHEVGRAILKGKIVLDYTHDLAAPTYVVELIEKCCSYAPNLRPKFEEIVDILKTSQVSWYDKDEEEGQSS